MAESFEPGARAARPTRAWWTLLTVSAASGLAALLSPACLERRDQRDTLAELGRCAGCHGDAKRPGDELARSAPPYDVSGHSDSAYPGVGAHLAHTSASASHGGVACGECHVVPERVDTPGHADDPRPAELRFGSLASHGERTPEYDPVARTCRDSYCHGGAQALWTAPRASNAACGSCHGLPPPAPHPQSEQCGACHGAVIDTAGRFVAPERHVDGYVDFEPGECALCHGTPGSAAPPPDTQGQDELASLGVGAHAAHLRGGALGRAAACEDCHRVPERIDDPTHADGGPAEVVFSGVAAAHGFAGRWDRDHATCSGSWCHSPSPDSAPSPAWNERAELDCGSCHGLPPAAPHPQLDDCSSCHGGVVADDDRTLLAADRHVDGVVDLDFDESCNTCHGDVNAAPPRDLAGNTDPEALGVGAHQVHLAGSERARAVPCSDCHLVPDDVRDPGHLDSSVPAEVVFSGAASAYGPNATYENGTCRLTSCHGGSFPEGHDSGGSLTEPVWNEVGQGQAACGTCHAIPPPPPHPNPGTFPCHMCHQNLAEDDVTFLRPELHVDGVVTLQVD